MNAEPVFTRRLVAVLATRPENRGEAVALAQMDLIMRQVAQRALELDDPPLHRLMVQLGLYSVADPDSPEYDESVVKEILK